MIAYVQTWADRRMGVLPLCDAYDMTAALYGLLGTLGGAFISAAAAYLVQRKANAAAAEQARLEREADAAERAEERARAEVERIRDEQIARHRARERQRDFAAQEERRRAIAKEHSVMERVIRVRSTNRVWCQMLSRFLEDLSGANCKGRRFRHGNAPCPGTALSLPLTRQCVMGS